MAFIQPTAQLRAAVASYSVLPITSNVLGDLRIVNDLGTLYTWSNASSSGALSDWHKISISTYGDLQGRPSSSPLAIDNAMESIRNIFMNYILIFYKNVINWGVIVEKMLNGLVDRFATAESIDPVHSSAYKYLASPVYDYTESFYVQNFDGTLDEYTKILIHDNSFSTAYHKVFDAVRNLIDPGTLVYGLGFNGASYGIQIDKANEDDWFENVDGEDFTFDVRLKPNHYQYHDGEGDHDLADNVPVIVQPGDFNFKIEITGIGHFIKVSYKSVTDVVVELTGSIELIQQTWAHVAVIRESGILKIYVDGILDAQTTVANNEAIKPTTGSQYENILRIGGHDQGWIERGMVVNYRGRMDEIRYSKGIARWTTTFTPPTVRYNTPTQTTDFSKKLLLHCDGTNNSTTIIDDSLAGKTISVAGNAKLDTSVKKFGTASLSLDGNGSYVSAPSSTDFNLTYLKSFTIEGWFNSSDVSKLQYLFSQRRDDWSYYGLRYDPSGKFVWEDNSFNENYLHRVIEGSFTLTNNTWYHIALVRKYFAPGNFEVDENNPFDTNNKAVWYLFINGVSIPLTLTAQDGGHPWEAWAWSIPIMEYAPMGWSSPFVVGADTKYLTNGFIGHIDEFRLSLSREDEVDFKYEGARYVTNFTPATTHFLSYSEQPAVNNMVIQSQGFDTNDVPTSARVVIFEEDEILQHEPLILDTITPKKDLRVWVSRDGGTTFTEATDLKIEFDVMSEFYTDWFETSINWYVGTVDLSTQPNGQLLVWKITTHNNRKMLIRSVAVNWK